jgi:glucose-6-phosphate 1-epimerase
MRSNGAMHHELPAGIVQMQDPGGRPAFRLEAADSTVLISSVGAQVLSWHFRGRDVLWSASQAEYQPGKAVRGGVPLVFPWFGNHPTQANLPAHGFARTLGWQVVDATAAPSITFTCSDDANTRTLWPFAFRLRFTVTLATTLKMALTIENPGTEAFSCEEAMHTYFAAGDIHKASVHGLENVACIEHAAAPEAAWDRGAPIHFRAETDRVFQGVPDRIELHAPALARRVTLVTEAVRSAIVWNPWPAKTARLSQMAADDWLRFVCIESANVKENPLQIAPGRSHTMTLTLAVDELR